MVLVLAGGCESGPGPDVSRPYAMSSLQKKLPEHHKMNFTLTKYVEPGKEGDSKGRCVFD